MVRGASWWRQRGGRVLCENRGVKLSRIPRGWLFVLVAVLYVVFGAVDRLNNGDPPLLVLEATALRALIYGAIAAGGYLLYRRVGAGRRRSPTSPAASVDAASGDGGDLASEPGPSERL